MLGRGAYAAGLALLLGCTPSKPSPAPAAPTLSVEYAGCKSVRRGSRCTLGPSRALRLWVSASSPARVALTLDGEPISAQAERIANGDAYRLEVPVGAQRLRITAERAGAETSQDIQFSVDPAPLALQRANDLRVQGKLDEAEAVLKPLVASTDPILRTQATRVLARILRVRGKTERAIALLRECIDDERASAPQSVASNCSSKPFRPFA